MDLRLRKSNGLQLTSNGQKRQRSAAIFIDRSLGKQVAEALRRFGLTVHTMADVYPDDGQDIDDTTWIRDAGQNGWIVLTQDQKIRERPSEIGAVMDHGAKVFCLHTQNLKAPAKTLYYGRHLLPILRRARRQGACFWRIRPEMTVKDIP